MIPLGFCSFLLKISLEASMAAINNMIQKSRALSPIFGQEIYSQIPMAVVGIVMKFFQIVISIVIGLAAGCIQIIGFNVGAQKNDRVLTHLKLLILSEIIVGAVAFIIAEFFPSQIFPIFGAGQESQYFTDFAILSFRVYFSTIILACINKAAFIFLQAYGKAFLSTMLSLIREVVFSVGFALLLLYL